MIRWIARHGQTVARRWRRPAAISMVVWTGGLLICFTVLWMGLNTYNTLRSLRATVDPLVSDALATGLVGDTKYGIHRAYTTEAPGSHGSGAIDVNLSPPYATNTLEKNMQTFLQHVYPSSTFPACPAPPIAGLNATAQSGMDAACAPYGFAWVPPAPWQSGYFLAGPIVIGDLQASTTQPPYTITLFGTTYQNPQPVVGAEVWIPVRFRLGTVPITTVVTAPVFFAVGFQS